MRPRGARGGGWRAKGPVRLTQRQGTGRCPLAMMGWILLLGAALLARSTLSIMGGERSRLAAEAKRNAPPPPPAEESKKKA